MIRVRALGHIRKALGTSVLELDYEVATVDLILKNLSFRLKDLNEPALSLTNTLITINGVDSSVLGGQKALIKDGDDLVLIPITHGG